MDISFWIFWMCTKAQVALVVKNPPDNAGDARVAGSIPRLGRSPGVGNGNPLQCSCLENSMGRGAWQATAWGHRVGHDWATGHIRHAIVRLERNCLTLPNCYTILHSHQELMRVLAVPHLEQQLGWLVFLILAIITSVEGYLIFVLISTAVEHLYMCLFATCIPSLMRCLFRLFAHFLLGCLFSYCWVLRDLCIFWVQVLYNICENIL